MQRLSVHLLAAIAFLGLAACEKVDDNPGCTPIPSYVGDIGYYREIDTNQHVYPCFNPASDDEYVFHYSRGADRKLVVGNISTGRARGIVNTDWRFGPRWGRNGMIVFNPLIAIFGSIAIVTPDGSGITAVTPPGRHYQGPEWNFEESAIVARDGSGYTVLISPTGDVLDTIAVYSTQYPVKFIDATTMITIRPEAPDNGTIGLYSVAGKTYTPIARCDPRTFSGSAVVNSSEFIWSDGTGIYLTNRESLKTERLRETCDAVLYTSPSINRSTTKILWSRKTTAASVDRRTLHIRTELVTTDLRGGNEKIVTPVVD